MKSKSNNVKMFDINLEKDLLGSIIQDNNLIEDANILHKNYFYAQIHGEIFEVINRIINTGLVADIKSITLELEKNVVAKDIVGSESDIEQKLEEMSANFTMTSVASQARIIYLMYMQRNMVAFGKELVTEVSQSTPTSIMELVSRAEDKMYQLTDEVSGKKKNFVSIGDHFKVILQHLDTVRKSDKKLSGISSGLLDLDNIIGGFKKGDLLILAARPSMGKTALATSIAYNIAKLLQDTKDSGNVLFFSLEMSGEQIATRIAAVHSKHNSRMFDTGRHFTMKGGFGKKVSDTEFKDLSADISSISSLPLFVDATPALKIAALYSRVRKMNKKKKISVLIVDYLQLLHGDHNNSSNRVQEISEITQGLKNIAKELNIPVIALSQLSRAVESREKNIPQLSDLRDSGTIEQDADIVMFLYREVYYMERKKPENPDLSMSPNHPEYITQKQEYDRFINVFSRIENLAQIIVAKNRNGPIGITNLSFDREHLTFSNRINHAMEQDDNSFDPF